MSDELYVVLKFGGYRLSGDYHIELLSSYVEYPPGKDFELVGLYANWQQALSSKTKSMEMDLAKLTAENDRINKAIDNNEMHLIAPRSGKSFAELKKDAELRLSEHIEMLEKVFSFDGVKERLLRGYEVWRPPIEFLRVFNSRDEKTRMANVWRRLGLIIVPLSEEEGRTR